MSRPDRRPLDHRRVPSFVPGEPGAELRAALEEAVGQRLGQQSRRCPTRRAAGPGRGTHEGCSRPVRGECPERRLAPAVERRASSPTRSTSKPAASTAAPGPSGDRTTATVTAGWSRNLQPRGVRPCRQARPVAFDHHSRSVGRLPEILGDGRRAKHGCASNGVSRVGDRAGTLGHPMTAPDAATGWATSGLMALTGHPEGRPMAGPGDPPA